MFLCGLVVALTLCALVIRAVQAALCWLTLHAEPVGALPR